MILKNLEQNRLAVVTGFSTPDPDLEVRLREIGFAEGDEVEILHVGLFGRNPITVKIGGTLIALRRNEATGIMVELKPEMKA